MIPTEEELGPNPITCWGHPTAEQLEACAKGQREGVALWVWNDDYFENILLWMEIWAEAKEEMMKKNPWVRQFPELFRAR
jgi:hypothetical protein